MNQKYPRVQHTVAPMLTGKLLDLFFDGQAFITGKADGVTGSSFIGLEPLPGFVVVDGFRIPNLLMAQRPIPGGDRRSPPLSRSQGAGIRSLSVTVSGSRHT